MTTQGGLRALPFVDVGGPTLGYLAVGASGFVLLASGPRLLGNDGFSALAVAWTLATIVGVGIGQPGEQTVTRVTAGGGDPAVSAGVQRRLAVVAGLTLLLPVLALLGEAPLLGGSVLWASAVVVFAAGWALLAGPRGRLAAATDYSGYSGTLVAEAVARVLLCLIAWWVPSSAAPWLLAAAIGVPILVSAVAARWRLSPTPTRVVAADGRAHASEQSFITAVALLSQIAVNSAPLWLAVRATDTALAGQFVSVTSYLRIPILLVGGLATVTLSAVSDAHGRDDRSRARGTALRSAAAAALVGAVGTAALLLVSGPALRFLYGSGLDIGMATLVVVAATTVLALTAGIVSLVCLGCDRSAAAAAVWALAAVATTAGLAVVSVEVLGAALVTAAGQVVAAVGLGLIAATALRDRPVGGPAATTPTV